MQRSSRLSQLRVFKLKCSPQLLCLILLLSTACAMRREQRTEKLLNELPPPVVFQPAEPIHFSLPNGLHVMFLEDRELPLVQGTIYMYGGELWSAKPGAAAAMGAQLRAGGAGRFSADQLDLHLEKIAASIGSSFGEEYGTVTFHALSEDFEEVMKLTAAVLLEPRFESARLRLWKGRELEGIRRRRDNPQTITSISLRQLLYRDSRYGRVLVEEDVAAISREDIRKAYHRFVRPDQAILAVSGDITVDRLKAVLNSHLAAWQPRGELLPAPPPLGETPVAGVYFIELPFSQSTLLMGQLGAQRLAPDYVAIDLFNQIFGSDGFGSKLMNRIRSDLGLAYTTYGAIIPGLNKGRNVVFLQTKAEATGQAGREALKVLAGLQEEPVDSGELEEKKRSEESSFVFKRASRNAQVNRAAILKLLGYPKDYDDTYLNKMAAVTTEDIQAVARKYWDLENLIVVIVGNDKAYQALVASIDSEPSALGELKLQRVEFKQSLLW